VTFPSKKQNPAGTGFQRTSNVGGQVDYSLIAHGCARVKKLPPYAREVIVALAAGKPGIFIFVGPRAWERCQRRRGEHGPGSALVIPNDAEPGAFDWTFLRGQAVVLHTDTITTANRPALIALSAELVSGGARFVAATDGVETFAARGVQS
jgi:hypothetical protein